MFRFFICICALISLSSCDFYHNLNSCPVINSSQTINREIILAHISQGQILKISEIARENSLHFFHRENDNFYPPPSADGTIKSPYHYNGFQLCDINSSIIIMNDVESDHFSVVIQARRDLTPIMSVYREVEIALKSP